MPEVHIKTWTKNIFLIILCYLKIKKGNLNIEKFLDNQRKE